ncbi:MAG: type IV secretory system conjugative DNA transfer family protein [Phreatobacter sp.]|uniref:type IV secretory system conjugative DNA transfer family protein n=1 Tax=Phreatobacter sp. TaxID=1966341 RepID=UPI002732C00E|nr:type IV secretory system conjugative DNA transfer family protein [Phreatobacter sp.]MDP2803421.1 type IV secretory system conjugative DNA transfer family protein [Phreatobacter sp.]
MTSGIMLGWERGIASSSRIGFMRPDERTTGLRRARGPVLDKGEGHALVVAPTGAGKSRSVAIPQLLHWNGSAVVLDIKGELHATTAAFRRDSLGHRVVVLDPWGVTDAPSDHLNPLDRLARKDANIPDLAYEAASMLVPSSDMRLDPFWMERGQTLIAGLIAFCATRPSAEYDGSFRRVWEMLHADDVIYSIASSLDLHEKAVHPFARSILAAFLQTTETTRSGILATAQSLVRVFASAPVQAAVHNTTFSLKQLQDGGKVTVYLVVPPALLESHAGLVRVWLSSLIGTLLERKHRPRLPTLLVLDEVAQLGRMPQISTIMTLSRGYGVRAMLFMQSLRQLTATYPNATALIENAGVMMTFGHSNLAQSSDMAALFGDVTADALYRLPQSDLAVKCAGSDTQFLTRCDGLYDTLFRGRATPNPMFIHERGAA